ncbi:MAG: site-2 protease family protein [Oligoflexus sp.]
MFSRKIPLFRILGFKVQLDLSWFIIAFLLIWLLSVSFFPMMYPNLEPMSYFWMSLLGVLGLFLSIVIHEFFHALVGKRYGMPISGITLFVFGGVAEMKEEPVSAKSEFWMAIAGPMASLVIAGVSYFGFRSAINLQWSPIVIGVLNYLWQINLILVLFNLIPAFPLDGGRILRSILWRWRGELKWATKISTAIGSGFGLVLIILGFLSFLGGNAIGGVWYLLIGLFIRLIARSSYRSLLIRTTIGDETVDRFMNTQPITVRPDISITALVTDFVLQYHHKSFPVVSEEGRLLGCVSTKDLHAVKRDQWRQTKIRQVMQPCQENNTIHSGTPVKSILDRISLQPDLRLLVVEDSRLLGLVNSRDVLRYLSIRLELSEQDLLEKPVDRQLPQRQEQQLLNPEQKGA